MKTKMNNWMLLILFLLIQNVANDVKAQIRIGGSTTPNPNAVLDLNANDTANGSQGLLLPRVALISTVDASPLVLHVEGMQVYNTAKRNDVSPGIYFNNGTKWIRINVENESYTVRNDIRHIEIPINEVIGMQSVIFYGTITSNQFGMKVSNIRAVFSDDMMRLTRLDVTQTAKNGETGEEIQWIVRVNNSNIDPTKTCILEKVVISYVCETDEDGNSPSKSEEYNSVMGYYVLVGQ
jgi:hypothetical protein